MEHTLRYDAPEISDLGTLRDLTLATGQIGSEDGAGKSVQAGTGPVEVSVGIFP